MSEDFTKMSTCLLCDTKIDAKSGICSTCAIIAMPDEDFQKIYYISLLEHVHFEIADNERARVFDLDTDFTQSESPVEYCKKKLMKPLGKMFYPKNKN
jgi:hypothetical protein